MMSILRKVYHSIFFQFSVVAAVLWGCHWISPFLISRYKIKIHVRPETLPLFGRVDANLSTWVILPLIAFGIYLFLVRSVLKAEHPIPLPVLLALFMGLKVTIDISVTMINGVFLPPATSSGVAQYFSDVPQFESVGDILRNYVSKANVLSVHSGTHPPGSVLVLWLATRLFVYDKMVKGFLIILSAPLVLILMYSLARQFYKDSRTALYTLALYLVTPSIILLTATSMDALFAVFLVFSIYLFFLSLKKESVIFAVLTGISFGLSMFLTFSTVFLGVYFIALTILTYFSDRKEFRNHLTVLLISGGTFCVFYLLMYWTTGYSFLACLRGAIEIDEKGSSTHGGCGTGYENLSRYFFISGTNLFAFFTGIGVPTVLLWLREVRNTVRDVFLKKEFSRFLLAYVVVLILIAFSTLYTTETERIWMFMAPFILIPASKSLKEYIDKKQNERMFYVVAVVLYIQTLALESLLNTTW